LGWRFSRNRIAWRANNSARLDKAITPKASRNRASSAAVQGRYRSPAAVKNFSP
jgi:hypothetical protein